MSDNDNASTLWTFPVVAGLRNKAIKRSNTQLHGVQLMIFIRMIYRDFALFEAPSV